MEAAEGGDVEEEEGGGVEEREREVRYCAGVPGPEREHQLQWYVESCPLIHLSETFASDTGNSSVCCRSVQVIHFQHLSKEFSIS